MFVSRCGRREKQTFILQKKIPHSSRNQGAYKCSFLCLSMQRNEPKKNLANYTQSFRPLLRPFLRKFAGNTRTLLLVVTGRLNYALFLHFFWQVHTGENKSSRCGRCEKQNHITFVAEAQRQKGLVKLFALYLCKQIIYIEPWKNFYLIATLLKLVACINHCALS